MSESSATSRSDTALAKVALLLFPVAVAAPSGLAVAVILAVALLPVTAPTVLRYRGSSSVVILFGVALVGAPLLVSWSLDGSVRTIDSYNAAKVTAQVSLSVLSFMMFVWARTLMSTRTLASFYSVGILLAALFAPESAKANPWKYTLGYPVTLLLLCRYGKSTRAAFVGLAAAGIVSLASGSRSFFGFCVATVVVSILIDRPHTRQPVKRRWKTVTFTATALGCLLFGGSRLAGDGYFGQAIQQHTVAQKGAGVPVVLSVRPESAAAVSLLGRRPIGFGPGVVPTVADVDLAKSGLLRIGSADSGEYVDGYLFGGRIELHSVVFDLWAGLGIPGLAAAIATGCWLVAAWSKQIGGPRKIMLTFLMIVSLWNLAFSPLSSLTTILFSLALVLELRPGRTGVSQLGSGVKRRVLVQQPRSSCEPPGIVGLGGESTG